MANYYCKWCGHKYASVANMATGGSCSRNPAKKHELYEGSEKSQYTCKHCGRKFGSIANMATGGTCSKSPTKTHQPAL